MNKLIPFKKYSKNATIIPSRASVILDKDNIPAGFIFGRNAFISLCTIIDEEFEKRVSDPRKAYDNPAGRIIDAIEEKLPVNPKFAQDLKDSIKNTKEKDLLSLDEIARFLNV